MRPSPSLWALGLAADAQGSAGFLSPTSQVETHDTTIRSAAALVVERRAAPAAYWYSQVQHNGISPTIADGGNWTVFRNVKDFGAKGDGATDDLAAIQAAITLGNAQGTRASGLFGVTQQPAVVYFPAGTYVLNAPLQNFVDTVLMGDPTDRPVLKAGSSFDDATLLIGRDPNLAGLNAFQNEVKNLVLDSTALASRGDFNLLVSPDVLHHFHGPVRD